MANKDFVALADQLQEILNENGHEVNVRYRKTWKNNVELDCFEVRKADNNVAPSIYFSGDENIEEIAERTMRALNTVPEIDVTKLIDPDYILHNAFPKLYSYTAENVHGFNNQGVSFYPVVHTMHKILDETNFYDGAMVAIAVEVEKVNENIGSFLLSDNHLKHAGLNFDQVYAQAIRNMEEAYHIQSMDEIMREMLSAPWEDMGINIDDLIPDSEPKMYVLTNTRKFYGASMILSGKVLKKAESTLGTGEYFIIPSSVHEVILVPDTGNMDPWELKQMVKDVNATQVAPNERLFDGVLHYSHGTIERI